MLEFLIKCSRKRILFELEKIFLCSNKRHYVNYKSLDIDKGLIVNRKTPF